MIFRAQGATLIEILVSLVLLSLMLLGLDAMQLTALREAKVSLYYAEASQQLHLMQEKLTALHLSDPADAINRWNQQNAAVLPHGRGVAQNGVISVFWGDMNLDRCEHNKIGLSGCVTTALNQLPDPS